MGEWESKKRPIMLTSEELCDVLIILERDLDDRKRTLQRWKGNDERPGVFDDESDKIAYVAKMADSAKKLEKGINFTEQIIEKIKSSIK